MNLLYCIIALVLFSELTLAKRKQKKRVKVDGSVYNVRQEYSCLTAGGMCRMARQCISSGDPTIDIQDDLCLKQYKFGVRCCQPLPLKETRCLKHGGRCRKNNGKCDGAIYWGATDCRKKRICCISLL